MMKKLVFAFVVVALSTSAKAQDTSAMVRQDTSMMVQETYSSQNAYGNKTLIWSIGIEPSIPVGHFNDLSGFGLGGSLQGEYKPGDRIGITANVGYVDYFGKSVNGVDYADFKYWPVLGGLKFYMSGNSYLHGQAGAGFGEEGLGTSFWYGAGIGLNLGKTVDAELKYAGWKQGIVTTNGTGGVYGGTGSGGGTGGGYGGHYSTIGLRLGINF